MYPISKVIFTGIAGGVADEVAVLEGDGEGLAAGSVAVAVREIDDDLDGFAGRAGALQGDVDEGAVVHDALGIGEAAAAAPGGLADDELVHVHIADGLPGAGHLLDAAQGAVAVPVADVEHRAGAEAAGGAEIEFSEETVGIGGVGDHGGAVFAGAGVTMTLVQASVPGAASSAKARMVHRNFRILSLFYKFAD